MTPLETLLARHGDAPTLEDFGGENELWAQADELATTRLWFRAAETLLTAWDRLTSPDRAAAFIAEALTTENRPGVVGDLLDRLCDHPGYLHHHAATLNRIALRRAESHATGLEAETAGLFLEAALRLALAGTTKRYALLDIAVDPQATAAPAGYARQVVRALGAAYEQWRDADLTTALHAFTDVPMLRSDAAFELAMCHLSDAFNATDRPSLLNQLTISRTHFDGAIGADEDRPDATAYRAAINAVLAFEAGDNEALATETAQLRRSTSEHTFWLTGLRTGWRDGRYDTEAAWYTLSTDLEQAANHLSTPLPTWPSQTIQHILAVYTAHRSVRLTSIGTASALQLLVAPRIEDAFAAREGLLLHVRGLLADAPPDWDRHAAEELRSAVESRLGLRPEEAVEDDPGKEGAAGALAAAIGNQVLAALPPGILDSLHEQLTDSELSHIPSLPKAEHDTFNKVVAGLQHCPDFQSPSVRKHFIRLLTATIRFLANRTNRGRDKHTKKTAYLFAPKPGEKLPLEIELQEDLHDYLDSACFEVQMETIDHSGGRADILVLFPGFNIVIECKRELKKAQPEDLKRYLGQTVAYQAAGITLGMLAVLDLTPKPHWLSNLRDSMWTEHVPAPDPAQRDRWAVVVRVPGNRTTPHDM